jgi:thiol-disulfide isomerase/thioredoxin
MKAFSERTRERLRSALGWVALLAAFVAIRAWQTRAAASGTAPELRGRTLAGVPVALAEHRGGPVAVHFWATWCGVCSLEEGNVVSLAEGGRVLTIASASGSAAEVRRYAESRGLSFPIVNDGDGSVARRWGVTAYPTTFYLDDAGVIRHVEVGYTTTLGMRARLALAGLGI